MPHLVIDPIVASSAIVMALQQIVSRRINPLSGGVVSVTYLEGGGGSFNVIPGGVTMKGTVRSMTTEGLRAIMTHVEDVVSTTALAYGCNATTSWSPDCKYGMVR